MEPLSVLIVDDEEDLVVAMKERLAMRGFSVQAAASGAEALGHISRTRFDVVLVDVKMPGIDGLELTEEIKRDHPDLPVILLTGHSSVADAERGIQAGAAGYLIKPIDIELLIENMRNAAAPRKGGEG